MFSRKLGLLFYLRSEICLSEEEIWDVSFSLVWPPAFRLASSPPHSIKSLLLGLFFKDRGGHRVYYIIMSIN